MNTAIETKNTVAFNNNVLNNHQTGFTPRQIPTANNWAFIDMQNLYRGVQEKGWKINWQRFRQFLRQRYSVTKAIVFMGYLEEYEYLYNSIQLAGFILVFREAERLTNGTIYNGNIDTDLVCDVMDHKNDYDKAIIVADDKDYYRTINSLKQQNKLKLIISSHTFRDTSERIKKAVGQSFILSIHNIKNQIV